MRRAPAMTNVHRQRRVSWVTEHLTKSHAFWDKVIWSDEKKFTLTGPDGLAYYWHDRRCQERIFKKKHSGGGSVMLWGCYSGAGKSAIAFINDRMNASSYCQILEEFMLPFAYCHHGTGRGDFVFMQDNARVHTANLTKNWLQALDIEVLEWPAVSPDLNPIENLWGILTQRVYRDGFLYDTVEDLKVGIQQAWDEIALLELDMLNKSMPRRCVMTVQSRGHTIAY